MLVFFECIDEKLSTIYHTSLASQIQANSFSKYNVKLLSSCPKTAYKEEIDSSFNDWINISRGIQQRFTLDVVLFCYFY